VLTANDYYPFGMIMPGRKYAFDDTYRYGFNGKENDNEVKGEGGQQDYGMRIYDPRLGRFLSVDPIGDEYPELTPYQFASNTPLWAIDLDGLEGLIATGTTPPFMSGKQWPTGMVVSDEMGHRINAKLTPEQKSALLDVLPLIGTAKGIYEAVTGEDFVTGEKLSATDRALAVVPYVGKAKKITKVAKAADKIDEVKGVAKAADKIDDAKTTEKALVKPKNKNANDAEGEFMLYDVHSEPNKQGELLKVGKADAERITSTGEPVRMKASERKARRAGYPNATATERKKLGRTTTGKAKESEAAEVKIEREKGNQLPLNKEKEKKYKL